MHSGLTKALACGALMLSPGTAAAAQQAAFQDARGESSMFMKEGGGFARINATDKSSGFDYLRARGDERVYFAIEFFPAPILPAPTGSSCRGSLCSSRRISNRRR
jgi:hypothetical protein